MPAEPSGLYLADGLLIISKDSMAPAGICSKFIPVNSIGLPSIIILTCSLPLKFTFPSPSMVTEGILLSKSTACPAGLLNNCEALYTLRSMLLAR